MTTRRFPSPALGLLLAIATISIGCAAQSGEREEVPHSSRDQFAQQLDVLDERIDRLAELSEGRAEARAAVLAARRAEVERRLEELDQEAPTFTADRQLVEEELFQLEADVATLQRELRAPVRAAHARPAGPVRAGATSG